MNAISRLRNRLGQWCVSVDEIQRTILEQFETLFRSSNPREEDTSAALEGMQARMYPYKSPGLDGMSHAFFQKYWHIVVPEVALKLDLSKAYDRVGWLFLERVLAKLGFHPIFIELIRLYISIVSYSIMLTGNKCGYFHPQRGLHQGDLLLQYLFLFCAEALGNLLRMAEERGEIKVVAISHQGPRVSHLLFADDTLIFCQASKEDLGCVRHVLETLEAASGLSVNLEKSSMTFSKNTPIEKREELAAILEV
ncbi:UNVERIFIED_CONTAM: hypothetical protein Slati_2091600 [Sesamum latifolium]|uniref:Reverse transcriptase domain-containing protein n=1 Tax=Sesamum latifolium TaxID=2727402 RepID=A0AAW2WNZ9_9LAMI